MGRLKYLKNVTTLKLNVDKCVGCGMCEKVCPHGVFEIRDRKAIITDKDLCMECGACAMNCAAVAIEVRAGVGCAAAVILGSITGTEPTCGCCGDSDAPSEPCC
jgi:NAD-dependent dihydropyrimidine dehydrogenase PreA subunit